MQKLILAALVVALLGGLAIGAQASLNSAAGKIMGATLTGLLVNFLGGALRVLPMRCLKSVSRLAYQQLSPVK